LGLSNACTPINLARFLLCRRYRLAHSRLSRSRLIHHWWRLFRLSWLREVRLLRRLRSSLRIRRSITCATHVSAQRAWGSPPRCSLFSSIGVRCFLWGRLGFLRIIWTWLLYLVFYRLIRWLRRSGSVVVPRT